jgi:hypothetical protein
MIHGIIKIRRIGASETCFNMQCIGRIVKELLLEDSIDGDSSFSGNLLVG